MVCWSIKRFPLVAALQHSIWCLVLWGLHADTRPWKPIPRSSRHTDFVLILMPVEVWYSSALESAERWWLYRPYTSLGDHRSVTLPGLLLRCWIAAFPKCFHFPIIPLTADAEYETEMKFHKLTYCKSAIIKVWLLTSLSFSEKTFFPY